MKQKAINALSWASFIAIVFAVGVGSLMAGICVVNYLAAALCVTGTWRAFILAPVLLVVSLGVETFLLLGLKRFGQ